MAPIALTPPAIEIKSLDSVPRKSLPPTSNIGTKRKIICFSDFDGTIFMQDTGHILFNNFGCGSERRKILDEQIHSGERSFRDVSEEMWGSLDVPFEDGFEVMKGELTPDPEFATFHKFCINNEIPFNVISAGLKPVLRRVLDHFLGEEASKHIDIVANDATISSDGSQWKPVWLHDTELGHDKAKSINDYKDTARLESDDGTIPMIVFIGDGVSDLPAAREADVLFARRGLRLEEYCQENSLPYIPFDTFADIQKEIIKIAKIDDEKTKGKGLPSNFNPRANMWRRVSSKNAVPIFAAMTPSREEKMFVWPEAFTALKTPLDGPPLEVEELAIAAAA
ncbi:HAD-like domain-containing protein [Clohesyomyces aquaticus]|uniref:HAD-like domain-containing protein n=1 Tax=Clohesyomyces aquaticus TaxID=1231657 RepID=A0A1Y2AB30_9PLEO|nr:HAD-like domain-containing protein [Clohesyomyces aquaticus]